jgi:serine/threonine-protein kinase
MSEVLVKQMRDPPPVPSQRVPAVPGDVDQLVLKMLAKAPEQRHRDAYHLVEDLRVLLDRIPGAGAGGAQDIRASKPVPQPLAATQLAQVPSSPLPAAKSEASGGAASPSHASSKSPPPSGHASSDASYEGARPTLHVPSDRDDWRERVAQYRRQLNGLHPDGDIPRHVADSMQSLERIVAEASRLRTALHGCAQELADNQNDLRGTRLRIGRALDELASDESKLVRAHGAELAELTAVETKANHALQSVLARPAIGRVALTRGERLSDDDALLLQGLGLAIENLREAQARVDKLRRDHQAQRAQLEDIRFQIDQLKSRLASMNAVSNTTQTAVQERAQSAESRLRDEMERLVSEAERVTLYLRTHGGRSQSKGSVSH